MIDVIFESILEFIVESYCSLMLLFIPEEKLDAGKLSIFAIAEVLLILIMVTIGAVMLAETSGESTIGKILLIIAVAVSVIQVALGVVAKIKSKRNNL